MSSVDMETQHSDATYSSSTELLTGIFTTTIKASWNRLWLEMQHTGGGGGKQWLTMSLGLRNRKWCVTYSLCDDTLLLWTQLTLRQDSNNLTAPCTADSSQGASVDQNNYVWSLPQMETERREEERLAIEGRKEHVTGSFQIMALSSYVVFN